MNDIKFQILINEMSILEIIPKITAFLKELLKVEKNKKYDIEIKKHREKRGLKANAYYWELVNQLANLLRMSKEEMHFNLLQKYGQSEMVSVLSNVDVKPYFRYYSEAGETVLNGKKFKHYKVYKGSSEMDSKEMSILINGLVDECQIQGIETKPKAEIESLLKNWRS